jgi:hypothetical protein
LLAADLFGASQHLCGCTSYFVALPGFGFVLSQTLRWIDEWQLKNDNYSVIAARQWGMRSPAQ